MVQNMGSGAWLMAHDTDDQQVMAHGRSLEWASNGESGCPNLPSGKRKPLERFAVQTSHIVLS